MTLSELRNALKKASEGQNVLNLGRHDDVQGLTVFLAPNGEDLLVSIGSMSYDPCGEKDPEVESFIAGVKAQGGVIGIHNINSGYAIITHYETLTVS